MYGKDVLNGILISIGNPEVNIVNSNKSKLGYRVRLRVCIRGKDTFLWGINRSLLQHEIESNYKDKEHSGRPKPILVISGLDNLTRLVDMMDSKLIANSDWDTFIASLRMIKEKEHLKAEGLEKILKMKGLV
tara:strand:- start:35064 stop:35459 length:396 start_codon:yes stop_codon:yes gene_type:complete